MNRLRTWLESETGVTVLSVLCYVALLGLVVWLGQPIEVIYEP